MLLYHPILQFQLLESQPTPLRFPGQVTVVDSLQKL